MYWRNLPIPFYCGVALLAFVMLAGLAAACGHVATANLMAAGDGEADPPDHCCGCSERESLIDRLRGQLADARREALEARAERIDGRLDRIAERQAAPALKSTCDNCQPVQTAVKVVEQTTVEATAPARIVRFRPRR